MDMKFLKRILMIVLILGITLLAFSLRAYASERLYYDEDEDTYLSAALNYANYMREGKYSWLAWDTTNFEHPSFYKIVYGVVLLSHDPLDHFNKTDFVYNTPISNSQAAEYALADRRVSVVFGSLTVLALAILNPLAGFFLAINSLGIKYTSEIYLEALPMLSSLLSILAYGMFYQSAVKDLKNSKKSYLWLGASALFLGITAASKYVYCIAGLAIVLHWVIALVRKKLPARQVYVLLGWGVVSMLMFFVFDPYLWPHPISRIIKTLTFHVNFQNAEFVKGYPFWQVLQWLFNPFAHYDVRPRSAVLLQVEPLLFILALIGLPRTIKKNSLYAIWLVIGLLFLMTWGTKWPQYTMIILVPFSLAASQGILTLYELIIRALDHLKKGDRLVKEKTQ